MSWLADRDIQYIYKMKDGSTRHLKLTAKDDPPSEHTFEDGEVGTYAGFEKEEVRQVNMVEYDQNGRKAVKIKDKDGKVSYLSKTKINYLKTGRIENQYTKAYQEHLQKTQQEQMLRGESRKSKGTVSRASLDEVLKNMPDGEYVSDGVNVMPAPKINQK